MTLAHTLIAVFINLLWGSMYIVATIGLQEFPAVLFTAIRFALLCLLLSIFIPVPREQVKPLLMVGLLMGVGMYLTLYISLALAENTASVAVISKLEVPFAILLGVVILKEKFGIKRVIGVSIAMIGAVAITFDPAAIDDLPALFWMTVSAVFSAYAAIKIRLLQGVSPITITAWISLVAAPVLFTTSAIFEWDSWNRVADASWIGWSALIYTAVMSSIVSNSLQYYLLQKYPVSQVAPYMLLSPIFAVAGGVLFLDDQLTPMLMAGSFLVLLGIGWINYRQD